MKKSIGEMANFIKGQMPPGMLDGYTFRPMFTSIASESQLREGVLAFRGFLRKVYDFLINEGSLYEKSETKTEENNYDHVDVVSLAVGCPFINNMTSILMTIGYYGQLAENGSSIVFDNWHSLTSVVGPQGAIAGKQKLTISAPKVMEALRLLASCGLCFTGIDLDTKKPDLAKLAISGISYPDNPAMLTGLKVMAIAHIGLSTKNDYYVFQRCDYRILGSELSDVSVYVKDCVYSLPIAVQDFALALHRRTLEEGLTCTMKMHYFNVTFTYSRKSNVAWELLSLSDGCYIATKAKKLDKYADDIKAFPLFLQDKISRGYGCEKKRFGEPCQKGCHGFSFPLDASILGIAQGVEMWLDKEVACLQR